MITAILLALVGFFLANHLLWLWSLRGMPSGPLPVPLIGNLFTWVRLVFGISPDLPGFLHPVPAFLHVVAHHE